MTIALLIAFAGAVVLAWILARKQPEHQPIATLLSIGLGVDAVQLVLEVGVLAPLRAELGVQAPWTGWAHAAGLLATAVWMIWPAAIVAASLVVFARRRPWAAIVGWGCALAAFILSHPIAGDGSAARAMAAVQVLATVVSIGIFVAKYQRGLMPVTSAQFALAMIVATESISLLGAWRVGPFEHWPDSQALYLVLFGVLILTQGRVLWKSPQPCA